MAISPKWKTLAASAPVARVISPNNEMSVSPDDVIDIKFEAHDDHGIAARPTAEMAPEDVAFRDMTNDELSKIFYAGADKKGRY